MKGNHPFVKWAIKSIESYISHKQMVDPIENGAPEELLKRRAGAFVSLHLLDGSLRGCIGTFMPTKSNLALEVRDNAIAAATEDPRFEPLTPDELDKIEVTVDILSEPEKVTNLSQLDPKKYGVIVVSGYRRGLLLADLPGVDNVQEQLRIALRKAGISERERFDVYRFTVERYH